MGQTQTEKTQVARARAKEELGMSLSAAYGVLNRKIIFNFIELTGKNSCYRCKLPMTFADYTVEHIEPWRRAENATELYFDLSNISFSHAKCNSGAARKGGWNRGNITHGTSGYRSGCRCDVCRTTYSAERRAKYIRRKT